MSHCTVVRQLSVILSNTKTYVYTSAHITILFIIIYVSNCQFIFNCISILMCSRWDVPVNDCWMHQSLLIYSVLLTVNLAVPFDKKKLPYNDY